MQRLKLNHDDARLVRTGQLHETWRLNDEKKLSVNDRVELIDKVNPDDPSTWEIMGIATINEVVEKRLVEAGFNRGMYKQFRQYYKTAVKPQAAVKLITFSFQPYSKPRKFVVEGTLPVSLQEVKLYADGGSRGNPGPSASGFVILDMNNNVVKKAGEYLGITTNNQAEYQALKLGLEEARGIGAQIVFVYMDSQLVVNQMRGIYKVKNQDLLPIHQAIKELAATFKQVTYTYVPRELNKLADQMVNETLDAAETVPQST